MKVQGLVQSHLEYQLCLAYNCFKTQGCGSCRRRVKCLSLVQQTNALAINSLQCRTPQCKGQHHRMPFAKQHHRGGSSNRSMIDREQRHQNTIPATSTTNSVLQGFQRTQLWRRLYRKRDSRPILQLVSSLLYARGFANHNNSSSWLCLPVHPSSFGCVIIFAPSTAGRVAATGTAVAWSMVAAGCRI
jgi:hypothetical protein